MNVHPSATLQTLLEDGATARHGLTLVDGSTTEWARLHENALGTARSLQSRGVGPGTHVGVLGSTSRDLVTVVEAIWLAGGTVVVLPLRSRSQSVVAFLSRIRHHLAKADCHLVVTDDAMGPTVEEPARSRGVELCRAADLTVSGAQGFSAPPGDPGALAILQFTSGSTAEPRAVMISHRQLCANLRAITDTGRLDQSDDRWVSWLPLYHDMGLIGGLVTPRVTGMDLLLATPEQFVARPRRWMEWIANFGGTITAAPNFAYGLGSRMLRSGGDLDLSCLRVAFNGSEAIDPSVVEGFIAAASRHRFDARAMCCVYGLAEATAAVSMPQPSSGMEVDHIDRDVLEHDGLAQASDHAARTKRLVVLGEPIPSVSIRVTDIASTSPLPEREVGEVQIRGPSITAGYYQDARATEALICNDWLSTGDLGYLTAGSLVICGRRKDMIIVAGRNLAPEEPEASAATVHGVRYGSVVAVGAPGRAATEQLVIVAECRRRDVERVRAEVAHAIRAEVGITPMDIVLIDPHTLPKTSSGKLQRSLTRALYMADQLAVRRSGRS